MGNVPPELKTRPCQLSETEEGAECTGRVEKNAGRKGDAARPNEQGAQMPPNGGNRGSQTAPIQLS
ncbi:MAG: hypothetical protein EBR82_22850 [Caulobacteraceae bacterium]|nr:hypothetical protein [Caulobacteraceae bacterium]